MCDIQGLILFKCLHIIYVFVLSFLHFFIFSHFKFLHRFYIIFTLLPHCFCILFVSVSTLFTHCFYDVFALFAQYFRNVPSLHRFLIISIKFYIMSMTLLPNFYIAFALLPCLYILHLHTHSHQLSVFTSLYSHSAYVSVYSIPN